MLGVVAAVCVLVLASCSASDDSDGVEIRAFSEVQDGPMTFEPDAVDPSRGIFRVTTTEPMICAIVWGEDESLGRFNNSLAMSGTGIEQHDVVLPDVEPGREYTFVVQGTTADGTLYRSEVSTFVIERSDADTPESAVPDVGDNLTVDAVVVEVSSEFSDAFAGANAIDGDPATEWSTAGDGDDGSITIDLGSEREIGALEFVTRSMADGSSITDTFTVTVDGGDPIGPFPAGTPGARHIEELSIRGQVLRFDVASSTGGNVGAVEIAVYGPR